MGKMSEDRAVEGYKIDVFLTREEIQRLAGGDSVTVDRDEDDDEVLKVASVTISPHAVG